MRGRDTYNAGSIDGNGEDRAAIGKRREVDPGRFQDGQRARPVGSPFPQRANGARVRSVTLPSVSRTPKDAQRSLYRDLLGYLRICYKAVRDRATSRRSRAESWTARPAGFLHLRLRYRQPSRDERSADPAPIDRASPTARDVDRPWFTRVGFATRLSTARFSISSDFHSGYIASIYDFLFVKASCRYANPFVVSFNNNDRRYAP